MFALSILYCILFFYIRIQLKSFRNLASSSSGHNTGNEPKNWQANLEAGIPAQPLTPQQIITTQTVTITTEDRNAPRRRHVTEADRTHRRMNQVALTLLCYPVAYIALTITLCITRLAQFGNRNWGLTPIYVGASIFECTGFVNVLLYTATRRGIISWNWLFKKGCKPSDAEKVRSPYLPHFPGNYRGRGKSDATIPKTLVSKPSDISISIHELQDVGKLSPTEPVCGLDLDRANPFADISDDDKLVHDPTCVMYSTETHALRDSNGSTLVGSCSCKTTAHNSRTPKPPKIPNP